MTANELLDELLSLFSEEIPGVTFRRAFSGVPGARLPERPVVTGEVESEAIKSASSETRLCFRIFLPSGVEAQKAEGIFEQMCTVCGPRYPTFSAISRGPAKRDSVTGLLEVACALTLLSSSGGGGDGSAHGGFDVLLGGKKYRASGVSTTMRSSGDSLVAVGETEPFALRGQKTEYTVELSGIETDGLAKLAAFTAVIGTAPQEVTYRGCRWKTISDVLRKASFISEHREEGEEYE